MTDPRQQARGTVDLWDNQLEHALNELSGIAFNEGRLLERGNPKTSRITEMKDKKKALIKKYTEQKVLEASEIFVPVRGAEGYYEVSNTGKVRSVKGGRRKGGELAQGKRGKAGYLSVSLCKDGKTQSASVHRLVARAFISNPDKKPCVNHIDGNPSNNHVENLEWCTYSENELHSYKLGKTNSQAKLTKDQVKEIKTRLQNSEKYSSIAKDYGVDFTLIYQIKKGLIWNRVSQLAKIKEGES